MYFNENKVKTAVDRAGGPTKTALLIGCSGAAVHLWIRQRKISDINKARILADIAGMDVTALRPTL